MTPPGFISDAQMAELEKQQASAPVARPKGFISDAEMEALSPSAEVVDPVREQIVGGASGFLRGIADLPDQAYGLSKILRGDISPSPADHIGSDLIKKGANWISSKLGGSDNLFEQGGDTVSHKIGEFLPSIMALNPELSAEPVAEKILATSSPSIFSPLSKVSGRALSDLVTSSGSGAGQQYLSPYINQKIIEAGYPKTAPQVSNFIGPLIGGGATSIFSGLAGTLGTAIEKDLMGVDRSALRRAVKSGKTYVDSAGNEVPLEEATRLLTRLDNQHAALKENGYFDALSNDPKTGVLQSDQAVSAVGKAKGDLIKDAEQAGATVGTPNFKRAQSLIDTLRLGGDDATADKLQSILDRNKQNWSNGSQTITEGDLFKQATDSNGKLFTGPLSGEDSATKKLFKSLYHSYDDATDTAFDAALPDQAGDLSRANDLFGATKQAQAGAGKRFASQPGGFARSIFSNFLPDSIGNVANDVLAAASIFHPIADGLPLAARIFAETKPATAARFLTSLGEAASPLEAATAGAGLGSGNKPLFGQSSPPQSSQEELIPPKEDPLFSDSSRMGLMKYSNSQGGQLPQPLEQAGQPLQDPSIRDAYPGLLDEKRSIFRKLSSLSVPMSPDVPFLNGKGFTSSSPSIFSPPSAQKSIFSALLKPEFAKYEGNMKSSDASTWFKDGKPSAALLDSVKAVESSNGKNLVSPAGALGPYQLMPATAKAHGADPFDEDQAREAAAKELEQNFKLTKDPQLAVLAYNHGVGNVLKDLANAGSGTFADIAKYLHKIGNKEAATYVSKIMNSFPNNVG